MNLLARWTRAVPEQEHPRPAEALAAERRYLDELRRRIAWQAEAAHARDEREAAVAPVRDAPPPRSAPTLWELEALARRHAAEYPECAEEWSSTLYALRPYAEPDGRLPAELRPVVEAAFGALLAGRVR